MKPYEKENPDTMDLLFGLVDFNKFKAHMLRYKKGVIDVKGTTDAEKSE